MTKYTDNESYEKAKARIINILRLRGFKEAVNLLKQSKWIGDNTVLPRSVKKDKHN